MDKKELELKIKIMEHFIENDKTDRVVCYHHLAEKFNVTKKEIKPILENLKQNEMIELVKAFDDDGLMCGSGFILTTRANEWSFREWLVELKKIQEEEK